MNAFSNMITWAADTTRKQAAEGADLFGIEFGRIELTEHGQEASIGLNMFGGVSRLGSNGRSRSRWNPATSINCS